MGNPGSLVIGSIPILLYLAAVVLGLFAVPLPGAEEGLTPLASWMLLASLGLNSLWAAFGHTFAAETVARSIGWETSPFQTEIGGANLGIGLSAVAAPFLGAATAWAVFLMAASFLWGAAAVHVRDMIRARNFAISNAGPILWWDILTPLTLFIALLIPRA
jgi:hypothetical protein